MAAALSSRRGPVLYLTVSAGIGTALAATIVILSGAPWLNAMLLALPVTLVYAVAVGFSGYYLCRAYPLSGNHPAAIIAVMGVAALAAGLLWILLVRLWNAALLLPEVAWGGVDLGHGLSVLVFGIGVLLYGLSVAVHYLLLEFVRAETAERRELESQLMAQEAELRMLRTQIDPHFLFNSLNSISALTSFKPAAAREMTLELASFFRKSLGMEANKKVTLAEELALIRHFLAIETVRFGARLTVEEQVEDEVLACLVPPMIIQPLVENAVKHGICNLTEGGSIRITARRDGAVLHIGVVNSIADDMPGVAGGGGAGIGLANVRQRLAAAYRHQAGVHWRRSKDTFDVEISMPVQLSGE